MIWIKLLKLILILRENLVDKSRLIPSFFILLFVLLFYYLKLDLIFILFFASSILYDFYKSGLINFSDILKNIFIFILSLLIFYLSINFIEILFVFSLLSILSLFVSKVYKHFFFIILIILFLVFSYDLLRFDRNLFFLIIILSFINDTSAYIFGRFFKGPLIISSISPNKTWSGTLSSFFISFLFLYYFNFEILFCIIIAVSFFLGDIFFSYIKRFLNIKDFSNLLGGHGGILDRFDSIFFVIFIFIFKIYFL